MFLWFLFFCLRIVVMFFLFYRARSVPAIRRDVKSTNISFSSCSCLVLVQCGAFCWVKAVGCDVIDAFGSIVCSAQYFIHTVSRGTNLIYKSGAI